MTTVRGSANTRRVVSALGAAALYGTWAFHANHGHGLGRAGRAALTQVCTSFLLTVLVVSVVEALFRVPERAWARVALSTAGAVLVTMAVTVTAHTLAGTPELLRTVALSFTLGTALNLGYALNLLRLLARPRR
ncbi:MAG: hypothetical protein HY909_09650 [Deltaproteobacteria bacterium]|nr:hypothetical protein [Deltaproteobacteria bacterium]